MKGNNNRKNNSGKKEKSFKNLDIIGQSADRWVAEIWDAFVGKLASTNSKKEIKSLIEGFLGEHERRSVARRLAVTALLRSGYMQKDIGNMLWVAAEAETKPARYYS